MTGHGKPVYKVASNPKQPMLATCSADMTVRLWNPDSGAAIKTLTGPTDYVYAVAFSPDGNLVAAGTFKGEVNVWKVDGTVLKAFNASPGYVAKK
jgi:WD40 repeat protein